MKRQEQASETFLDTFGAQSRKRSACAMFSSELVENTGRRACFLGPPFCCNLPLVSGPDGVLKGGDIVCFACFFAPAVLTELASSIRVFVWVYGRASLSKTPRLCSVFGAPSKVERVCPRHGACAVFWMYGRSSLFKTQRLCSSFGAHS